jgi:hypothetical protein
VSLVSMILVWKCLQEGQLSIQGHMITFFIMMCCSLRLGAALHQ